MVLTEYSKINNLILAYPERYYNEYERLISFYDSLINLIPNDIQLWLITNNNATKQKLENKYRYKKNQCHWDKGMGRNLAEGLCRNQYR